MTDYIIHITETLRGDVIIRAHDSVEAEEIAERWCNNGLINMVMNYWCGRTVECDGIAVEDDYTYHKMYGESGEIYDSPKMIMRELT